MNLLNLREELCDNSKIVIFGYTIAIGGIAVAINMILILLFCLLWVPFRNEPVTSGEALTYILGPMFLAMLTFLGLVFNDSIYKVCKKAIKISFCFVITLTNKIKNTNR